MTKLGIEAERVPDSAGYRLRKKDVEIKAPLDVGLGRPARAAVRYSRSMRDFAKTRDALMGADVLFVYSEGSRQPQFVVLTYERLAALLKALGVRR